MINIKIDNDYRITSDKYNFILQKKRVLTGDNIRGRQARPENVGKEIWIDEGYYGTIKHLLRDYATKRMLKPGAESEIETFQELFGILKDIGLTIQEVNKHINVSLCSDMINIKIDNDYRITNDKYNFILQKRRIITNNARGRRTNPENIGKEVWTDEGYYTNIKFLLKRYATKKTLESEIETFQELFGILRGIESTIKHILDVNDLI